MPFTDGGRRRFLDRLIGVSTTALDASNCHIGVGDSSTAFAAAQTDLQAASNKFRKLVSTAPARVGDVITYVAIFATGEANFAWNEAGGFDNSSGGLMAWRYVQNFGTKASGQWTLTTTQTVSSS